jgi:hypothetical protein
LPLAIALADKGFEARTTLDEMLDEVIPWISEAIKRGAI